VKQSLVYQKNIFSSRCNAVKSLVLSNEYCLYRVIINDCAIVVGVKNPHKFWMCRQPRNVKLV
jgi:hypothetical protein